MVEVNDGEFLWDYYGVHSDQELVFYGHAFDDNAKHEHKQAVNVWTHSMMLNLLNSFFVILGYDEGYLNFDGCH